MVSAARRPSQWPQLSQRALGGYHCYENTLPLEAWGPDYLETG